MNKHTYTKEQLDAMSDFDITVACANKLGYPITDTNGSGIIVFNGVSQVIFNPLKNFNDCMSIAVKHDFIIEINMDIFYEKEVSVEQQTLQRAIVYCYLMMDVNK